MSFLDKVLHRGIDWAFDRLSSAGDFTPSSGTVTIVSDSNFKEAAAELQRAIVSSTTAVINKIESDKLELLGSRIRSMGDLVRLRDRAEILRYTFTLREVVDYAENRVHEGKKDWNGPLLMGKVAIFSALQACAADSQDDREELSAICRAMQYEVLEQMAVSQVQLGKPIPWSEVASFLNSGDKGALDSIVNILPVKKILDDNLVDVNIELDVKLYNGKEEIVVSSISVSVGEKVGVNRMLIWGDCGDAFDEGFVAGVDGIVESILVKPGDVVLPGALIARVRRV